MTVWREEALKLVAGGGYSWRKISDILGVPKSTVSDYLRNVFSGQGKVSVNGPKILFFDIETAPLRAFLWSMWQNGIGLNQLQNDWFILSYAAKWAHSDEVMYKDLRGKVHTEDDRELLQDLWNLMNEADIIVGQNSKKFDTKKINARFIINGFSKPSTFRQIDTLEIAKRQFGFTSRKLEYMTDKLCVNTKKSKHEKFPGQELWNQCMKDNPEAWQEMEEYNKDDVISLEELYNLFAEWDNSLPNFDLYSDDLIDMDEWIEDGFHYTNLGKYQKYRHKKTNIQRRGRINLLSKEKRQSLLANIVA